MVDYNNPLHIHSEVRRLEDLSRNETSQLGFNGKNLSTILLLKRKLAAEERRLDFECIIKITLERGENLDFIRVSSKPGLIELLNVYKQRYDLVSHDDGSPTAVTLARVIKCFPRFACWYMLHSAKNPVVPFVKMNSISANYPKVMMTSAFAFLIPNTNEYYCVLLKNAHMLHQCQFHRQSLNLRRTFNRDRTAYSELNIINLVINETEAAIAESHILYEEQMNLLKIYKAISVVDTEIRLPKEVLDAAKAWDELLKLHQNVAVRVEITQLPNVTESVI